MKKIYDYLLIGVFIMTALLAAVVGLRTYSGYMEKQAIEEEAERLYLEAVMARNTEAQDRVMEMESEIAGMIEDVEALQMFIDETVTIANEIQSRKETGGMPENDIPVLSDSISDNMTASDKTAVFDDETVSGNLTDSDNLAASVDETVSGNLAASVDETVSGNLAASVDETVSGNLAASVDETVSGNRAASGDGTVSGNLAAFGSETVSGNLAAFGSETVSGNLAAFGDKTVSGNRTGSDGNTASGNLPSFGMLLGSVPEDNAAVNYYDGSMTGSAIFDDWRPIYEQTEMSLEERRELRTSYQETLEVNQADREWIAENRFDFSQMKIACLGDSLTAAANLEGEEDYRQYAYPTRLQQLLGAKEVYNLGIGGSSIGRYWADAFVERYTEIPEDTDIIIVLGGANDGFCVSDDEFGNLSERAYRTFCGDLNELMGGLRENYPDAMIFFATPLPNVLQDYLMSEREYLLPQKDFVEVIKTLADEYDFEVVDLYNSNILDSHDANIIAEYMPDGVHGNPEGYQILAEHFASELVQYYNEDGSEDRDAETDGSGGEDNGTDADIEENADTDTETGAEDLDGMAADGETEERNDTDRDADGETEEGNDTDRDADEETDEDGDMDIGSDTRTDGYHNTDADRGRRRYEY